MKIFPIIPILLMSILCLIMLFIIIKNNKKDYLKISIVILLFIVNLRIMYPKENIKSVSNNLDVLFVIDTTVSMNALDVNYQTRLGALKEDAKTIVKELNGARFSIIKFDNTAKTLIPYTDDANLVNESIEILNPIQNYYANGSSLNIAYDETLDSLKSAAKKKNRKRIIFFISDGEITNGDELKSFKELKSLISSGAVLGYGTTKGGYMQVKNELNNTSEYIMDYTKVPMEKAISKINESNLKKIAKDLNVDYIHMTKSTNINKKITQIKKDIDYNMKNSDKENYSDTYQFVLIPLLILFIVEFINNKRSLL